MEGRAVYTEARPRTCKPGVRFSIPERGTMGNVGDRGVLEIGGVLGMPKAELAIACYGGRG